MTEQTSFVRIPDVLRRIGGLGVTGLPTLTLLLLIFYPLAAIILLSVFPHFYSSAVPDLTVSFNSFSQVFNDHRTYVAMVNTLWISAVTAVLSCIIGALLAVVVQRTDVPGRNLIHVLVWVVFFTPSYMLGESWVLVLMKGGIPDQYLNFSREFVNTFLSPLGVILVSAFKGFPLTYLAVSAALQGLGSEFEDAARISGAPLWWAWIRINLPLVLPAILAGGLLIFADTLSDFGTASTIAVNASVPLLTFQIYSATNMAPVDFSQAATLSVLLFGGTVLALLAQGQILRRRSFQVISGRSRPARRLELRRWKWPVVIICTAFFMIALVIPASMSVLVSFMKAMYNGLDPANLTLYNYQRALNSASADDLLALWRSFILSFGAASIATIVALPVAFIIRRTQTPGRGVLNFLTLATVAVPGIVLACGYIFAWNAPYLKFIGIGTQNGIKIYGTLWVVLGVYIASGLPFATRLGIGALDQVGQSLLETARVQGANLFQVLTRVIAPLLRTSLTSTWLLIFSGSMFALATAELLYPPGQPTAAVVIAKYFNDTDREAGMALSVLTVLVVALMLVLIRVVLPRVFNLLRRSANAATSDVSMSEQPETVPIIAPSGMD